MANYFREQKGSENHGEKCSVRVAVLFTVELNTCSWATFSYMTQHIASSGLFWEREILLSSPTGKARFIYVIEDVT